MVINWAVGRRQDDVLGAFVTYGWLITKTFVVEKSIGRVDGNQCNDVVCNNDTVSKR